MHGIDLKEIIDEIAVHLPDLAFVNWCSEIFFINKGIFNRIDLWFFEYGFYNITARRKGIIYFLRYLHSKNLYNPNKMYLQFGKGGLKAYFDSFAHECLHERRQYVH
ncbi:hypothetical protein ACQKIC_02260 [Peribacillus sp. NPDC046944]|uniref:hypothetical protein n=1 Tax=unclassified Peribacillus TaxID=2675266 RepID=UPI003D00855E